MKELLVESDCFGALIVSCYLLPEPRSSYPPSPVQAVPLWKELSESVSSIVPLSVCVSATAFVTPDSQP